MVEQKKDNTISHLEQEEEIKQDSQKGMQENDQQEPVCEDNDNQKQQEQNGNEYNEYNEENTELQEKIAGLEEKIAGLEEEKSSLLYQVQRLQADFTNYRKRVSKEKEALNTDIKSELIGELFPIIDNFERALVSHDGSDDFYKGVEMIYRQLTSFLEKQGIEVIPAVGEHFDHNFHEAVLQVEDEEHESGIIIEELQKGYILNERVIRPSMVKVAK